MKQILCARHSHTAARSGMAPTILTNGAWKQDYSSLILSRMAPRSIFIHSSVFFSGDFNKRIGAFVSFLGGVLSSWRKSLLKDSRGTKANFSPRGVLLKNEFSTQSFANNGAKGQTVLFKT
jgi:hypothetical protein